MPTPRSKQLVVLCDGTWCGRETNTESNIQILASMFGVDFPTVRLPNSPEKKSYQTVRGNVKAAYFEGVGLGKSFLEYLFDGATASSIAEENTQVYQYIVENYSEDCDIWLFGLSRGAFTVRSVAGIINNCGIIKRLDTSAATATLCQEVYKIYRSPHESDKPSSQQSKEFRASASWQVDQPIRFMGLLDTVGSLGIPRFNAGVGFDWPEFYDQVVSTEVQNVYHALSIHDRLWTFQPCFAYSKSPKVNVKQKWFPGAHYDLGRQRFRFFRSGNNVIERLIFFVPDKLTKTVEPNQILSDVVLQWMLDCISKHDSEGVLIPHIEAEISACTSRISSGENTGSGDVYGNLIPHLPGGELWKSVSWIGNRTFRFLDRLLPAYKLGTAIEEILGIKTLLRILLETRDRRIPDINMDVLPFRSPAPGTINSVASMAQMDRSEGHYASKTYESYLLWLYAQGRLGKGKYEVLLGQ